MYDNAADVLIKIGYLIASFFVIQGAPLDFYVVLGIFLMLDFIFAYLIGRNIHKKSYWIAVGKLLNTIFFILFLSVMFNTVCMFKNSLIEWGMMAFKTLLVFYALSVTKQAIVYFSTTDVAPDLQKFLLLLQNILSKFTKEENYNGLHDKHRRSYRHDEDPKGSKKSDDNEGNGDQDA